MSDKLKSQRGSLRGSRSSTPKPSSSKFFVIELTVPGTNHKQEIKVKRGETADDIARNFCKKYNVKPDEATLRPIIDKLNLYMQQAYQHREQQYQVREKELKLMAKSLQSDNYRLKDSLKEAHQIVSKANFSG